MKDDKKDDEWVEEPHETYEHQWEDDKKEVVEKEDETNYLLPKQENTYLAHN